MALESHLLLPVVRSLPRESLTSQVWVSRFRIHLADSAHLGVLAILQQAHTDRKSVPPEVAALG
jgi:hypothetical protein